MKEDQNRILIVEDEEDIRNLLIFNLKRNNFLIESTSNGQDALELIRNRKFDLILLDLMIPEIDGFDLTRIIRNDK